MSVGDLYVAMLSHLHLTILFFLNLKCGESLLLVNNCILHFVLSFEFEFHMLAFLL